MAFAFDEHMDGEGEQLRWSEREREGMREGVREGDECLVSKRLNLEMYS